MTADDEPILQVTADSANRGHFFIKARGQLRTFRGGRSATGTTVGTPAASHTEIFKVEDDDTVSGAHTVMTGEHGP